MDESPNFFNLSPTGESEPRMIPRKLNIFVGFPAYGGNGGVASESPDIRRWWARTLRVMEKDPRIDQVHEETIGDTPITMVRNRFVVNARKYNCDVLIMVDSDMNPDLHLRETGCQPFFESTFNFLYDHYDKGPCVVGAPYCGPPGLMGSENMYVFEWMAHGDHEEQTVFSLEQVPRVLAARMSGIQPAAALPTGMIMYDMRAFELIEPVKQTRTEVLEDLVKGKITKEEALRRLHQGWFYYEWSDNQAYEKSSTEDVTNTRDISLSGSAKLGYNPVYCNWDAPVGHWKPWCVRGKPLVLPAETVAESYRRAVMDSPINDDESLVDAAQLLGAMAKEPTNGQTKVKV